MYWVFGCVSVVEGCSLTPEWPELGDNGGAHGTSPVKPIHYLPDHATSGKRVQPLAWSEKLGVTPFDPV